MGWVLGRGRCGGERWALPALPFPVVLMPCVLPFCLDEWVQEFPDDPPSGLPGAPLALSLLLSRMAFCRSCSKWRSRASRWVAH